MNITYATNGHEIHVTYRVEVEQEEAPVRGNAMMSGDAEADKAYEDAIIRRLARGSVWAWAAVTVIAEVEVDGETFEGRDQLGCCSYADEKDFRHDPYFADMCGEALGDLKARLEAAVKRGTIAANVRDALA